MWKAGTVEIRSAHQDKQLLIDGVMITDGLSDIVWEEDCLALPNVCPVCYEPYCQDPDEMTLRLAGNVVVMMPVVGDESECEHDYDPDSVVDDPEYIRERGVIAFDIDKYRKVQSMVIEHCNPPGPTYSLPDPESLRPLMASEALRILQLEAPHCVLGKYPDPVRIDWRILDPLHESCLDPGVGLGPVRELIREYGESDRAVKLWPLSEGRGSVMTYRFGKYPTDWRTGAQVKSEFRLFFEPAYFAEFCRT